MEMLLMGICMSVFGFGIACAAFGAAMKPRALPEPKPASVKARVPARFFTSEITGTTVALPRVPIEALLLQIEKHVRLEQAAAENFLAIPTSAHLHSRTVSPFVN